MQELIQPLDAPIGSTLSCSGRMAWHGMAFSKTTTGRQFSILRRVWIKVNELCTAIQNPYAALQAPRTVRY
jgi:hypothetical protein